MAQKGLADLVLLALWADLAWKSLPRRTLTGKLTLQPVSLTAPVVWRVCGRMGRESSASMHLWTLNGLVGIMEILLMV